MDFPLLSTITFLPLIGALFIFFIMRGEEEVVAQNAKQVALWTSIVTFGLSLVMLLNFDRTTSIMQFVEERPWVDYLGIYYRMGVDGISVLFVVLTALLTPLCILVSWDSVKKNVRAFMAAFLVLESFVIGVFCAMDMLLFYIFWEAMLIPMFIIIGVWGGEQRVYAAVKFFLYTFIGSVLMLVAMLYLYFQAQGSFDIQHMATLGLPLDVQKWLWLALFAAFAVKVPMWPFHTWLPAAHVQAPTAGSVILAGVLLKMGAYGYLRFSLPILPDASMYFAPFVFVLSVIAIIYTALVAFMQKDIKKMIAYSSVSHMGFVTLGIFAANVESLQGSILQMVNHGIVSSALFMLIGVIYDRMHTRDLGRFGGVVTVMPVYAVIFVLFVMAAVGLPGTNSFVSEFLILMGSYQTAQLPTVLATSGVVLGAVYMLWLTRNMIFGPVVHEEVRNLHDMNKREVLMFVPLIILVIWIGLMPNWILSVTETSVRHLVEYLPNGMLYESYKVADVMGVNQ